MSETIPQTTRVTLFERSVTEERPGVFLIGFDVDEKREEVLIERFGADEALRLIQWAVDVASSNCKVESVTLKGLALNQEERSVIFAIRELAA